LNNVQYVVCYENKGNVEEIPFFDKDRAKAFYEIIHENNATSHVCLREERIMAQADRMVENNITLKINYPKTEMKDDEELNDSTNEFCSYLKRFEDDIEKLKTEMSALVKSHTKDEKKLSKEIVEDMIKKIKGLGSSY
jgi:hypothetical protein